MTLRLAMVTFYPEDSRVVSGGIRMVAYNLVQALRAYPDLELHVVHCHADIAHDHTERDGAATLHFLALPKQRLVPNLITGVQRLIRLLRAIAGSIARRATLVRLPPSILTCHKPAPSGSPVLKSCVLE